VPSASRWASNALPRSMPSSHDLETAGIASGPRLSDTTSHRTTRAIPARKLESESLPARRRAPPIRARGCRAKPAGFGLFVARSQRGKPWIETGCVTSLFRTRFHIQHPVKSPQRRISAAAGCAVHTKSSVCATASRRSSGDECLRSGLVTQTSTSAGPPAPSRGGNPWTPRSRRLSQIVFWGSAGPVDSGAMRRRESHISRTSAADYRRGVNG
jgi:hypothetical protein